MKKILFLFVIVSIFILPPLYFFATKKPPEKNIVFWSIQLKPVYEEQMNKIIAQFEASHPPYKIVWVDIPIQEAQKRTLASVLSSNPPDLVNLNPDFSVALAQKNALHFFQEEDVKQFSESLVDKLRYEGKIYALPYYATSPVTIYNKEKLSKCIKKEIKSYDDVVNASKETKDCLDCPIFSASINENDTLAKILNKYNIDDLSDEKQKKKAAEVYAMFDELYKTNNLPKDVLAINHRENIEKYMSNQAGMVVAGSNFVNMIKQNAPDVYKNSELSPQLVGDNKKFDVSLMNLIIPEKSKNKEIALEFALTLTNKKNQLDFAKVTNVLPANKYALEDEYFKKCEEDLYEKSRCVSASQLDNLGNKDFGDKNKKAINEEINKNLEEVLLDEDIDLSEIESKIEELAKQIKILQE